MASDKTKLFSASKEFRSASSLLQQGQNKEKGICQPQEIPSTLEPILPGQVQHDHDLVQALVPPEIKPLPDLPASGCEIAQKTDASAVPHSDPFQSVEPDPFEDIEDPFIGPNDNVVNPANTGGNTAELNKQIVLTVKDSRKKQKVILARKRSLQFLDEFVAKRQKIQDNNAVHVIWPKKALYSQNSNTYYNSVKVNNIKYKISDFAFVWNDTSVEDPDSKTVKNYWIGQIKTLYKSKEDDTNMVECNWFYRPEDTIYKWNKQTHDRELFLTDHIDAIPLESLLKNCEVKPSKAIPDLRAYVEVEDQYFYKKKYDSKNKCFVKGLFF